ncbi:cytidylate kinase [Caminicella sporogenes DSM 14501]|uniref:Cytidylate kinase n=1 Tax=Caminicella sporogenes DSM 14501 TaxID=1121266 RepID=A0A1M6L5H6_9FIRM|nr:(d)CMP kinase [Caminicella sporogenes]RKD27707.1 cytidylate kinase [Caminicella sporogenes]SHJ66299.1 cytidylate kinase [Caminicella sporogenes DSM 14501]
MANLSIAIDGPAGAGKSTIAKKIALLKNLVYIDTGAMYRAFTLKLINKNIPLDNYDLIKEVLKDTEIDIVDGKIYLDNVNVSSEIRKPIINKNVSQIASIPFVREFLVKLQRKIAENNNVIMDGRDIGTKVLPDAKYKFFLTASIEERAKRRYKELKEKGYKCSLKDVIDEIANRDKMDSERKVDPLKKADDAILIDTTGKTIEKVINEILSMIDM